MTQYGQFCPVAKAMEILDERWTMLVIRELLMGSRHFNELRRGVPRMSPALLSKRLRALERHGIVARRLEAQRSIYELTPCGADLFGIVNGLGVWALTWFPELGDDDLDPHLLMFDMRRTIPVQAWPSGRTVVEIRFTDVALLDAHGDRTMFGQSEEALTVRAAYEVHEPVDDPVFAVSIRHENGLLLSLTSTKADGIRTGRVSENGFVELRIPRLGILTGDYFVSVYCIDSHQQHVYDEIDRAFPFHVRAEGRVGKDGLIDLLPSWSFSNIEPIEVR